MASALLRRCAGRIRHQYFGEGDYEQSERTIQQLLTEAGVAGAGRDVVSVEGRGIEAPADWASLRSPENYVGYAPATESVFVRAQYHRAMESPWWPLKVVT